MELLRIGTKEVLNQSDWLMFLFAAIHLAVIIYFGTKHTTLEAKIARVKLHQQLGQATLDQVISITDKINQKKILVKNIGVICVFLVGAIHCAIVTYLAQQNVMFPFICLFAFLLLLLGVFWLKGAKVLVGGQHKNPFGGF